MLYVGRHQRRALLAQLALPLAFAIAFFQTGCSLAQRDQSKVELVVPSAGERAASRQALFRSLLPSTVDGFDCLALNVTGEGIETTDYGSGGCSDLGSTSTFVSVADGGTLTLSVPSGAARKVELVGVILPGGCPSGESLTDFLNRTAGASVVGIYRVGSTTSDVYQDSTITIENTFDAASPKYALSCFSYPAPTITAITPAYVGIAAQKAIAISGTGFLTGASAVIGTQECTSPTLSTDKTSLTCTTPAISTSGVLDVKITNPDGQTVTKSSGVTVFNALALTPATTNIRETATLQMTVASGVAPYSFAVSSGAGTISSSGLYTAPAFAKAVPTGEIITATDAAGNTSTATVSVYAALSLSSTSVSVVSGKSVTLTTGGGLAPVTFAKILRTDGVLTNSIYTAPSALSTHASEQVSATDAAGGTQTFQITILPLLTTSVSVTTLTPGNTGFAVSASGGWPPYSYLILNDSDPDGSVSGSGAYTAPLSQMTDVIRVTDSDANTTNVTISTLPGIALSPSSVTLAVGNSVTMAASLGSGTGY
ncbi:MAG: IPT/TIG domain-containing protein, partial [Bdellovibrionota bacterium]